VEPLRPDVCRRNPPQARRSHEGIYPLAVAARRGLREDQRRDALSMAGGGSRGRGAGILCQQDAGQAAALKFIKKPIKRHGSPRTIVTDGLRPYDAALGEIGNGDGQGVGRSLNNRAENSHQPFRRRERAMLRFRRMKTLQKFSSAHAAFHDHFNQYRPLRCRHDYKARRSAAMAEWKMLAA